jgi:hypothetical protein
MQVSDLDGDEWRDRLRWVMFMPDRLLRVGVHLLVRPTPTGELRATVSWGDRTVRPIQRLRSNEGRHRFAVSGPESPARA